MLRKYGTSVLCIILRIYCFFFFTEIDFYPMLYMYACALLRKRKVHIYLLSCAFIFTYMY